MEVDFLTLEQKAIELGGKYDYRQERFVFDSTYNERQFWRWLTSEETLENG